MGLRPARTCRGTKKQAWTRFSKRKPRKSYIKARPQNTLYHMIMGKDNEEYDMEIHLKTVIPIQLRDNALESARLAVNKCMEKNIPESYKFVIKPYPHVVIRENKMLTGAGADRLSSGMKKSFGRPTDRAARLKKNQTLFVVKTFSKNLDLVKEAYKRAQCKLSGKYRLDIKKLKG